jgi:hypothetical protein
MIMRRVTPGHESWGALDVDHPYAGEVISTEGCTT